MKLCTVVWRSMLLAAMAAAALAVGCSEDDVDSSGLYLLSGAVGDPVPVVIDGDLGTLQFTVTDNPIPNQPSATLLGLLTSNTIGVNVANETTGVNYNLTQGLQVSGAPTGVGEYKVVDTNGDGTTITITFYNEFNGATIHAAGDYTATVAVGSNEYFVVEEFVRDVTVTEL